MVLWCVMTAFVAHSAVAELKAGIAVRVVTPNPLLPVSGGLGIPSPADKKLGELTVRALVLADADTKIAIVAGDFIGFPAVLGNRVRAKISGISPENIMIGVSHCHSSPDMYGFRLNAEQTTSDLKYLDFVCDKMVEAITEALSKLEPVSLKIATGEAAEKIAYNYYAPNLYDRRCSVIQALKSDGKALTTLVNYAIHPEVIGPDQGICCPDMVGPLYDHITELGGGTPIFMNSAQGGMVTADCRGPDDKDIQTWDECIRIGNLLAEEAMKIVKGAPVQDNPDLFCAATTIMFPMDNATFVEVTSKSPLGYKINPDNTIGTQVNVVNIGNAQILTIPGEALPNIGFYLKRKMKGENNLLFGLTNDAFGYILTKEDWGSFERYKYVTRTSMGEMTGEILVDESLKFINSLPAPAKL